MASGQGVMLEFDQSVIGHLADIGYQPDVGARELCRQIPTLIETQLAIELLGGRVVFDKQPAEEPVARMNAS